MRISRQADYAVRVALDLADCHEARIKDIALRQHLSPAYVGRISQRLAQTGVLVNTRGRLGRLRLACPPDQISLLDIIEAVDGPMRIDRCLLAPSECGLESTCSVYGVGQEVLLQALAKLRSITLAQMVARRPSQ